MAVFTTNSPVRMSHRPSFLARFDAFFSAIGNARACAQEYQHLADMTDAQLAARDMKRADIVRHVARAYL